MAEVLFDRAFSRQVGGVPPPPALGGDVVPANVTGVGALDNGIVLPARTYDYSLGAVVVGIASLVAGASVTVAGNASPPRAGGGGTPPTCLENARSKRTSGMTHHPRG